MKTKRSSIIESLLTQTKLRQRNAQTAECPEGKRLPRRLNECSGSSTYETESTRLRKFCAHSLHKFCTLFALILRTFFAQVLRTFCSSFANIVCALMFAQALCEICLNVLKALQLAQIFDNNKGVARCQT